MKRDRILAATAGAAGLAIIAPGAALSAAAAGETPITQPLAPAAQDQTPPADQAAAPDQAAVDALIKRINDQLATLSPDASQADVEAAIVFALDQAQQPDNVVLAALRAIKATTKDKKVELALTNVTNLRERLANQGTGGLGGDGGDLGFGPSLNATGGGTSDYTPA
jgi:hypothetical protein